MVDAKINRATNLPMGRGNRERKQMVYEELSEAQFMKVYNDVTNTSTMTSLTPLL